MKSSALHTRFCNPYKCTIQCNLPQATVEVVDRCMDTEPSLLHVSVVSLGRIEVRVPDRVQITRSIEAIVRLFDSAEQPMLLDARNLAPYDLHVAVHAADVADVKLAAQQTDLNVGEIRLVCLNRLVKGVNSKTH